MALNFIQNKLINAKLKKGKKTKNYFIYNKFLFNLKKEINENKILKADLNNKKEKKIPVYQLTTNTIIPKELKQIDKILYKSVSNILPKLSINEQKNKKIMITKYNKKKQYNISINWLLNFSEKNYQKLIKEIIDTYNKSGKSIVKKKENYKNIEKIMYILKRGKKKN